MLNCYAHPMLNSHLIVFLYKGEYVAKDTINLYQVSGPLICSLFCFVCYFLFSYLVHARVIAPGGETNIFEIQTCVLQGDTLVPFLFITVLENNSLRMAIPDDRAHELGFTIKPRQARRIGRKTFQIVALPMI